MKLFLFTIVFVIFAVTCPMFAVDGLAQTSHKVSLDEEMRKELSLKRNRANFTKVVGMLASFLRTLKGELASQNPALVKETSLKVEDLMNEANLFASQGEYDESYKNLETAYEILVSASAQGGCQLC